jgi:hypothetical protein
MQRITHLLTSIFQHDGKEQLVVDTRSLQCSTLSHINMLSSRDTQPHRSLLHNCYLVRIRKPTANEVREVESNLLQHASMLMRKLQTISPYLAVLFDTAQLSLKQDVKLVHMLFGPLDTRRHELLRKALLEHVDGILDHDKVDVRDLEDIVGEIAFKRALTGVR